MIKKLLKLRPSEYYLTHLRLVNAILPDKLTESELGMLARFMQHGGFTTAARKAIMQETGVSPSNLSNYINNLVKKKFVVAFVDDKGHKQYKFLDTIVVNPDRELYEFALINELD